MHIKTKRSMSGFRDTRIVAPVALAAMLLASHGATAAKWATHTAMPNGLTQAAGASIDGINYVVGGNTSEYLNTLYGYNIVTNTWSQLQNLPASESQPAAAVINDQLYVAGGCVPGGAANGLFLYDPPSNSWTTLASIPHLSCAGAGGVIGGKLYLVTPFDQDWANEFDVYDPSTNAWSSLPRPSVTHYAGAYGVINGKLYVSGGHSAPSVWTAVTEVYDPVANSWTTLAQLPELVNDMASAVVNGKLYVAGGNTCDNPRCDVGSVYIYDFHKNTWKAGLSLPTPLAGGAGSTAYGFFWVNGGVDSSQNFTTTNVALGVPAAIP